MNSTTLVTFRFKTPPEIRNVELFGSWDNFSKGYRLDKDAHKGRGSWSGCHQFENIICDGVKPNWSKPRSGGLKQGGKYWYYYKLDDEDEQHDETQPTTTACPLLPGQTVNIIEVPIEVMERPRRVSSAGAIMTAPIAPAMSLDPADRYKKVYRKHPTKLPRHYCSSDALQERATLLPSSSVMECGGPVRPPPSLKQKTSHRILKRVRGSHAQPYQQPVSCFSRPTSAEAEALLQSIAATIPELGRLPTLRPFGPTPPYLTASEQDRPTTRHGSAEGRPFGFNSGRNHLVDERPSSRHGSAEDRIRAPFIGFGASPVYAPDYHRPSTSFGSVEAQSIGLGITFPSPAALQNGAPRPVTPFAYPSPSDRPDWALRHPNPLAANPSTPGPVSPLSNPRSLSGDQLMSSSPPDELHLSGRSFDDRRGGTGIFDMLSPTFTAATMSSVDDQDAPPSASFRLNDYMDHDYTSAWLASTQSTPPSSPEDDEQHAADLPVRKQRHSSSVTVVFSGENKSSATLMPSTALAVHSDAARSEYTSFPEFVSSSPTALESEHVVGGEETEPAVDPGSDFAREVFGALGLRKFGWV